MTIPGRLIEKLFLCFGQIFVGIGLAMNGIHAPHLLRAAILTIAIGLLVGFFLLRSANTGLPQLDRRLANRLGYVSTAVMLPLVGYAMWVTFVLD